jgi:ATP-dependent DNA ligase
MLAKLADALPAGDGLLYEPKWDGFRAIVYKGGGDVYIQSRDLRPLDRYFPELHDVLTERLPDDCVLDGEIVIVTPQGLDFDALQLRLHPAASRVAKLAEATPASFVAFDALAIAGRDLRDQPQHERRAALERALAGAAPPVHLTPMTRDVKLAREWVDRFEGAGLDGEIVIVTPQGLDFDALQLRLHPAASRVAKLAGATPSSFVAFDALAIAGRDLRDRPQHERRAALERALAGVAPPVHVTPMTRDVALAREWLDRFEGAGLDGVIVKPADGTYQPGKRAMIKVKHARTADCVVAGFRWHKSGPDAVGSLLLGLYDDRGRLQHVGVTSSFTMAARRQLVAELQPLRAHALDDHPWREWATAAGETSRMPGGHSRWSAGKDLSWEPLRVERVCEVKYDHLQGDRFRHAATFLRWRLDRQPQDCRYDQLDVTTPYELEKVFGARGG